MTVTKKSFYGYGDGDGEKKHDYTVFFTGAGYVSPLVPEYSEYHVKSSKFFDFLRLEIN